MEKGRLKKLIIPLIFEQLLAVSVGVIDTFMVSKVGEAAVSVCGPANGMQPSECPRQLCRVSRCISENRLSCSSRKGT